jgi:hypothetical protein
VTPTDATAFPADLSSAFPAVYVTSEPVLTPAALQAIRERVLFARLARQRRPKRNRDVETQVGEDDWTSRSSVASPLSQMCPASPVPSSGLGPEQPVLGGEDRSSNIDQQFGVLPKRNRAESEETPFRSNEGEEPSHDTEPSL